MNVLVVNCGSSSVKVTVFALDATERVLAHAAADRVDDHETAVRRLLASIAAQDAHAVGHRIVHGGGRFTAPVIIDDGVLDALAGLRELAPLHNTPALAGIRAARAVVGTAIPMVAVFDSAFHATLSERAWRYAIPRELADRHGARRYGFHGLSCRAVLARYSALAGVPRERATLIVLHLGSGCSATAIHEGRSVDTSMGLTPLEGLVMGTRSGDVDPALPSFLARVEGASADHVEGLLNHRSGLLALSGTSADMRELLARGAHDDRARLAVDVFCYRARKYIGAYLAALGDAQAIIFTGGIGEHAPEVRGRICEGLEGFGIVLDPTRNAAVGSTPARISSDEARIALWVIPTDEERVIARDTVACLTAPRPGPAR